MSVILAISDTQEPFAHQDALAFCQHLIKPFRDRGDEIIVVHQGDEVDQHTLGRWPANPDGLSGGAELAEAKHRLSYWFDAFPDVMVCESNHTYRAWKKASEAGLPAEFLKSVAEVYGAPPGWRWAQRWIVDDICFEHGENVSGFNAARSAAIQNRMNTSIGHQHSNAGVQYATGIADQIWGMNTGCLIDVDAYAFRYGRAMRNKPTLGCGIVIHGIPHFVPMILSKTTKRWVGRSYVEESPS
jgi:hypothetical protein